MLVVFVLQNSAVVEIRFLIWTLSLPRALLIVLLIAAGMVLAWLLRGWRFLRRPR